MDRNGMRTAKSEKICDYFALKMILNQNAKSSLRNKKPKAHAAAHVLSYSPFMRDYFTCDVCGANFGPYFWLCQHCVGTLKCWQKQKFGWKFAISHIIRIKHEMELLRVGCDGFHFNFASPVIFHLFRHSLRVNGEYFLLKLFSCGTSASTFPKMSSFSS